VEDTRAGIVGVTLFVIACASAYYLRNADVLLGHFDLGWHLAAGDLIRQMGQVPQHDPWSFTAGNTHWFNLSWLWDVLASWIYQQAQFGGLVILTVVFGTAIAGCLLFITMRAGASVLASGVAALCACLLYPAFSGFPNIYLAASPNMATMLGCVIFFGVCLKPSRALLALPLVMLAWANLHGGFPLGLFLIGFFAAGALARRDWRAVGLYVATGLGCLAATLVNPLGWHIYQGVAGTLGNSAAAQITEWMSYFYNFHFPGSVPGLCYILLFAFVELRYRAPCRAEVRILAWLFLLAGLYQFRYLAFFFLFSTIPMALWLDRLLPARRDTGRLFVIAGLIMSCAVPLAWWQSVPQAGLPQLVSQNDARFLKTHFPHARLLNHWNFGGLIIFYDRGTPQLFVDGRAATAYPPGLLNDWFKLAREEVNPADWDMVLRKYGIETVMWVRTHDALRRFLVGARGWKEVYAGQYVSIYARPEGAARN